VLRHRAITIGSILSVFFASLLLFGRIGTEFFPDSDESQFTVTYRTPIGTRVENTEEVGKRFEDLVVKALGGPGAGDISVVTTMIPDSGLPVGRSAVFSQNTGPHAGVLQVNLVPRIERRETDVELTSRLRTASGETMPGVFQFYFVGGIVKRILNF